MNSKSDDSSQILSTQTLEVHKCSEEELGLTDSGDSKFYPIIDEIKSTVENMKSVFYCFDQSSVKIMNDDNSNQANFLSIQFRVPENLCNWDTRLNECVLS